MGEQQYSFRPFVLRPGCELLCAFLGCEVPDITFPRLNSSRHFVEKEWARG